MWDDHRFRAARATDRGCNAYPPLVMSETDATLRNEELQRARDQLDRCELVVEKLHALCCEPDRSPRMEQILTDIDRARRQIDDREPAVDVIATLERIGAQVGHLQIACCTDVRMPLYAETLSGLATTQIHISRSIGAGH